MTIADALGLLQIVEKQVHLQDWEKSQNHFAARSGPFCGKFLKEI
jgi:hypothetical protein